jgi:glutaredoxin 3
MLELPNKSLKQHHTIEIFSAGCPLCKHIIDDIQIGNCQGCNQPVYDINNMTDEVKRKAKDYGISSLPTTIIDGNTKVVGIPDFPWICSDDLDLKLKREYPLKH